MRSSKRIHPTKQETVQKSKAVLTTKEKGNSKALNFTTISKVEISNLPPFPSAGMTLPALQSIRNIVLNINCSWTTHDVCENLIKKWTKTDEISFAEYLVRHHSVKPHADLGLTARDSVRENASVFVSHAWRYRFVELVNCLECFYSENLSDEEKRSPVAFWVDLCVNSQWKVTTLPFEWWSSTFLNAVGAIGHTCLVLSPWDAPIPLTRAWCLWEILSTKSKNAKLTLQFSRDQVEAFEATLTNDFDHIMNAFCQIDVQKSEAQCPSDKQKIFDAVQHHDGGFRGVNLLVNNAIREWLLASARTALSRLQMKPPVNSALKEQKDDHIRAVIYLKCNVARLLNELGHYDGAEELLRSAHSDSAGVFPETHTTVYCILSTLSTVYTQQGKYQEAEELSTRAMRGLALDPEQREHYLSTTNNLAASLDKQGKRS